jgi:hypothetical protein
VCPRTLQWAFWVKVLDNSCLAGQIGASYRPDSIRTAYRRNLLVVVVELVVVELELVVVELELVVVVELELA